MRRKLFGIFFLMLGFMLSACGSEQAITDRQSEVVKESEMTSEDVEKNKMLIGNIDGKTVKNYRCTLTFENHDDRAISFCPDQYVIEVWKDKQWVPVQMLRDVRDFRAIECLWEPGILHQEDFIWIDVYGELSPGKYRLLISTTYDRTGEEAGKIVAEFQIGDTYDTAVEGLPVGDMYDPRVYICEIPEYGIHMEAVNPTKDGCDLKYSYTENASTASTGFKVGEGFCLQKWDPEKEQWSTIHTSFSDGIADTSNNIPTTVQVQWKEILGEQIGVFRIIVPVVADRYLGDYKVFYLSRVLLIL